MSGPYDPGPSKKKRDDSQNGAESESESEACEDHDASGSASGSAGGSSKKPRSAPGGSHKARLTGIHKIETMKHYQENPGMSFPELIE